MPAERLQLLSVIAHAKPVVMLCLLLLAAAIVSATAVWIVQLTKGRAVAAAGRVGIFLSGLMAAGPLIGLTAAAYGLFDMCIGIANVRPEPTVTILAPGFAEAGLCVTLGLLAASLAALYRLHLGLREAA
jgi:hypothetical protein